MGMKAIKDVCVTTGAYQDAQTGQQKKRRITIGTVFQDEESGNQSIKLDVVPPCGVCDKDGNGGGVWLSLFDKKPRGEQQQGGQQQQFQTPPPQQQAQQPMQQQQFQQQPPQQYQ